MKTEDVAPPSEPQGHAVVCGASLAGLFAARVLSEHFEQVTVLDHDELSEDPEPRRGAGQAHHSHVLLHAGVKAVDRLFEGLVEQLETFGAGLIDAGQDLKWFQNGRWKPRADSGVTMFWCERSRLEAAIRRRVRRLPGVDVVACHKVVDFISADGSTVEGVRTATGRDENSFEWPAQMVVDAMGRGSPTPRILSRRGHSEPPTESYDVDLGYASCKMSIPDDYGGDWQTLAIFPQIPKNGKMGVVYPVDDRRFHVTLVGMCGDYAPTDDAGFRRFAEQLAHPALAEVLEGAERMSKLRRWRIPETVWRRYDRMSNWPGGLVALGDAVCSFNPIYGQGMTICALEAETLGEQLEKQGSKPEIDTVFCREFQQQVAAMIRPAWWLAAVQDYRFPEIDGGGVTATAMAPIIDGLAEASADDEDVYRAFLEMITMKSSPSRLLDPRVLAPTLWEALRTWAA